jgi:ABC-2 type transport system permease protein
MTATADIEPRQRLRKPSLGEAALHGGLTLFVESFKRYFFSKRSIVLSLLFLVPAALTVLVRSLARPEISSSERFFDHIEYVTILTFMPTALLSFAALLNSVGLIQDEIEEQTLTYLLLRPTPRWTIYIAKLLAAALATTILACAFLAVSYLCLYVSSDYFDRVSGHLPKAMGALALTAVAYTSFFGLLGLLVKRSLVIGVVYIVVFEGILASIPFNFRSYTVIYYFRVMCHHWLGVPADFWGLQPTNIPDASRCVYTLLIASVVFALLGAFYTQRKEFRMKTPAGA